jgi:hypothetical protein
MPKITALPEATAVLGTDYLVMVSDPGVTPITKKITALNAGVAFTDVSHWARGGTLTDDSTVNLPVIGHSGLGMLVVGEDEERAMFSIQFDGTVNLIMASSNVVVNANTDGKICIGTSVASPCVVRNRIGSDKDILIVLDYT